MAESASVRIVVQRVAQASVSVAGEAVSSIGHGLCLLVGVAVGDGDDDARVAARKLAGLRVFPDEDGRMNRSLVEVGGQALVVSQFTLLGDTRRGRRPSFTKAAAPELAQPLIDLLAVHLEDRGVTVAQGIFGAKMQVTLVNDGPVTLVLEVRQGSIV